MVKNHLLTVKVWQHPQVRQIRHAMDVVRLSRLLLASQRRLPDYVIVGAQKAGTTSLWGALNEHPLVKPALTKEVHYFDRQYHRGPAWYRMHFPLKSNDGVSLTGEASPYYMFHPRVPERMAQTVPGAKIIFLLRNPVERAYSHYQFKVKRRQETLSFEDALVAEVERLWGEEARFATHDDYQSPTYDHYSYLARGRYVEQLRRWSEYFPADQMLVLESGFLFRQPRAAYAQVLGFLGLPDFTPGDFSNRYPGTYRDKMNPETRQQLVRYFSPYNAELYEHLGVRYNWQ